MYYQSPVTKELLIFDKKKTNYPVDTQVRCLGLLDVSEMCITDVVSSGFRTGQGWKLCCPLAAGRAVCCPLAAGRAEAER